MTAQQLNNMHPTGKTTGTAERQGHEVVGQALTFDLAEEARRLHQEQQWQRSGQNSRTLAKEGDLRLVLLVLKQGSKIAEHTMEGRLAVQAIGGRLRIQVPGRDVTLAAGQLLVVDYAVRYEIEALEESSLLLTVAYPAGLRAEPR